MDTFDKRVNFMNWESYDSIALTPDGSVDLDDGENMAWILFYFDYPEPIIDISVAKTNYFIPIFV